MAGSKVSNFAIGDSNIQSVMLTLDKTFKGQHQVSLTNYDTTAESQVAAGSVIEIGGALYKFDSNESITGTPSDGTVYIMAVPSGDSVTCAYTNTAPTWSDSKQGWYGTGATANNRYLEFLFYLKSTAWIVKEQFKYSYKKNNLLVAEYEKYISLTNNTEISMSAPQSITEPAAAPVLGNVLLKIDTIDKDILGLHNYRTYTFTAKRDGDYFLSGTYTESTGFGRQLKAIKNGTTQTILQASGGGGTFSNIKITMKRDDDLKFYTEAAFGAGTYTVRATISVRHELLL